MVFIKNTKKGSETRVFEPFLNLFSIGTGSHYARKDVTPIPALISLGLTTPSGVLSHFVPAGP